MSDILFALIIFAVIALAAWVEVTTRRDDGDDWTEDSLDERREEWGQ